MAFDVLSFAIGRQTAKGGSSGESNVAYKYSYTTLSGTWNERVSIDFGFKPDVLFIYANSSLNITGKYMMFLGYSKRFKEIVGTGGIKAWNYSNGNLSINSTSDNIEDTGKANAAINSADETGFTFGASHAAGAHNIYAFKFF